jgi:rifampicin phosphotransferase
MKGLDKPYFFNFQTFNDLEEKTNTAGIDPSPTRGPDLGNKFVNLARINPYFNVPNALCLTSRFFDEALSRQPGLLQFIKNYFSELQATFGCFLVESIKELDSHLDSFTLPETSAEQVKMALSQTFPGFPELTFAIRSSAQQEDGQHASFAGIYDSVLEVKGFDPIIRAIIRVWKSYYNYSAIVTRIRSQDFEPFPKINVMIQQMVAARISGVAFSTPPDAAETGEVPAEPLVEWVEGNGEKLVSGCEDVQRFSPSLPGNRLDPRLKHQLDQVCQTTLQLKEFFTHEIDVEWSWDENRLYILQVRPITTLEHHPTLREPFIHIYNLYLDPLLSGEQNLGKCADIYRLYVKKRAPAYLLAARHQVATGLSLFLQFNRSGLQQEFSLLESRLKESEIKKVIIDIDHALRQTIIPKKELYDYLLNTFKNAEDHEPHAMIIRDFISGEFGFISQLLPGNRLLIEASSQGLMDINRGLANCSEILCRADQKKNILSITANQNESGAPPLTEHFNPVSCRQILVFTEIMNRQFPNVKLEWVLRKKIPYFIDFSMESGSWDYDGENKEHRRIIYRGIASGPLFRLESKENLNRLSISPGVSVSRIDDMLKSNEELYQLIETIKHLPQKPVIIAKRPYAVLSYLLDDAAAFIFEGGSLLCHLSILLREARVPSLICPAIHQLLTNKKSAIIHHETIIGGE